MKLVKFDGDRLGLLNENGVVDLTDRLGLTSSDPLIEYIRNDCNASAYTEAESDHALADVSLESPVARPGKVIAAPLNYEKHIEESITDQDIDLDDWFSIEDFGYFLKAPSSIVGPSESVVVPFSDRRVDHEIELAFLLAEDTKDVSAEDAWEKIFGYTILLDITVRGDQDRSSRKSYDTFTVIGPWIVTADEIDDPHDLEMELQVNGEARQRESTGDMVYSCADIVQYASIGTTVEAGDVVTTGTPEGVGPIEGDDVIDAKIESIGAMSVDVEERDIQFSNVDVQKSQQKSE